MFMLDYDVTISPVVDDNVRHYVARSATLSISATGLSPESALANVTRQIEGYINHIKENNDTIPTPDYLT